MPCILDINPEPFISIRLASGIKIEAVALSIGATYATLLCGLPDRRINTNVIRNNAEVYYQRWSRLPVHYVPVEVRELTLPKSSPEHPPRIGLIMPPVEIAAHFRSSYEPSEGMGTELILVWHQTNLNPLMSSEIQAKVEQLDWPNLAQEDAGP